MAAVEVCAGRAAANSSAHGSTADDELAELLAGLEALHPALEELKRTKSKIETGSATKEDIARFKEVASTAKKSKGLLTRASPTRLRQLDAFFNQRETRRVVALIRQAQEVDLCFVLDATGSMMGVIHAVKTQMQALVEQLRSSIPHLKLRLAVVGYRDIHDGADRFAMTDFTADVPVFERALADMVAKGGGDECEDVIGGLHQSLGLNWQHKTKVMMLCGDAPCHGSQYHCGRNDDYPRGTGMSARPILMQLRELGVDVTFMSMGSVTDLMIEKFNQECGGEQPYISTMLMDHADLMRSTIATVLSSIKSSVAASASAASSFRRTFEPFEPVIEKIIEHAERSAAPASPVPALSPTPALRREQQVVGGCDASRGMASNDLDWTLLSPESLDWTLQPPPAFAQPLELGGVLSGQEVVESVLDRRRNFVVNGQSGGGSAFV